MRGDRLIPGLNRRKRLSWMGSVGEKLPIGQVAACVAEQRQFTDRRTLSRAPHRPGGNCPALRRESFRGGVCPALQWVDVQNQRTKEDP